MSKPFFFRIDAAEFLNEVLKYSTDKELAKFTRQLAFELATQNPQSEYGKHVYSEAVNFIDKKRKAGRMGGEKRVSNAKAKVKQCSSDASSNAQASSSSIKDKVIRGTFVPPSIQEVEDYCKERNKGVSAEKWYNHYQAKGWMIGKNKMKDWKAAVHTWENNGESKPKEIDRSNPNVWY